MAGRVAEDGRSLPVKLPPNVWRALRVYCVLEDKRESAIVSLALTRLLQEVPNVQVKQVLRGEAAPKG